MVCSQACCGGRPAAAAVSVGRVGLRAARSKLFFQPASTGSRWPCWSVPSKRLACRPVVVPGGQVGLHTLSGRFMYGGHHHPSGFNVSRRPTGYLLVRQTPQLTCGALPGMHQQPSAPMAFPRSSSSRRKVPERPSTAQYVFGSVTRFGCHERQSCNCPKLVEGPASGIRRPACSGSCWPGWLVRCSRRYTADSLFVPRTYVQ